MTHLPPPPRSLGAADLAALGHLLPPTAQTMRRVLGDDATAILINQRAGVQLRIPLHRAANTAGAERWAALAYLIGDDATAAAAAQWGGGLLDVPLCQRLVAERRDRWLRARYDQLTSPHGARLSANAAIHQLAVALAHGGQPFTAREIEKALTRTDIGPDDVAPEPPSNQPQLWGDEEAAA
ncbi:MAG: hypothetical protein LCH73_02760 [Proteobacteria bacterium]|nr:hypothetical protein [Pseudomonadota bacterium]